jgi:serine/threonine protein kinase
MVMDWGVAKYLNAGPMPRERRDELEAAGGTQLGALVGTRGFMPPEQARGEAAVDRRADVYSLGAILFLLLTGTPPAAESDPARSIGWRRELPKALRAICARALSADPAQRYQSVTDLAADVGRYRAGHAVLAYEESPFERLSRFARTYRTAILLILAYIIMRAAVAVMAGW